MKKLLSFLCLISLVLPLFACNPASDTEAPSVTVPSEAAETMPSESRETEAPSSEPVSEAPSSSADPDEETKPARYTRVSYSSAAKALSEEARSVLEEYLEHLICSEDVSDVPFISEEIKEHWDFHGDAGNIISVKNRIYESDDCFVVYLTRSVNTNYGVTTDRCHLIRADKSGDSWMIEKDLYRDGALTNTEDFIRSLLTEVREKAPISDQEQEEARAAAIEKNRTAVASKMDAGKKEDYQAALQALYDPEWENEWLPRIFNLSSWNLNSPLLLLYVMHPAVQDGTAPNYISDLYRPDTSGWTFILKKSEKGWTVSRPEREKEPDPPRSTWNLDDTPKEAQLVKINKNYGTAEALTNQEADIVLSYADLLLNEPAAPETSAISEEVRLQWRYWYGADPRVFVTGKLWSDEDLLVVTFLLSRQMDGGEQVHLVKFVRKNGQWVAEKDVTGSQGLLWYDFPDEAVEICRDLFYRERAIRPLTEEDLKAIEDAVVEYELIFMSSFTTDSFDPARYREGLSLKYDPDWENEYLYNILHAGSYMTPRALVYVVNDNEGLNQNHPSHPWVAHYEEGTGWRAEFLNEGWAPEPEPISFTEETYPTVKWSVSAGRLAASIQFEYTGKAEADYTLTNAYYCCQDLVRGKCDVLLSGEPTSDFFTDAAYNNVTLDLEMIGSDPFVFFVSTDNPVESLTVFQVRGIYSGQITNWKEVGGKDAEIVAFQQPTNSVSQIGMKSLVMQDEEMIAPVTKDVLGVHGDSYIRDVIMRFDESENAIGYAYGSYANALYLNENVKVLALDGVLPEAEAVRSGDYPLVGGIYAITRKGDKSENTQKLIKGLLSPSGQNCVLQEGFVPVLNVGEYIPAERAKSDEPVLRLTDTYETNPVHVATKTGTYEGVEYQYGVLLGLSDPAVTEKINQMLHEDALACLKKAMEMVPGGDQIRNFVITEFNTGNLLSVCTQIFFYKQVGNFAQDNYTSYVGTNVRLDTGERLTLQDLFRDDAEGKDIFNIGSYWGVLTKTITGTPNYYGYKNVEDRLLLFTRRYDEGDDFHFYFTPCCVCLLDEQGISNGLPLKLWFEDCLEAAAAYGKYAGLRVDYDGSYESCAGIPVLTERGDPLKNTVEKTSGYFLDAALYDFSDEGENNLPEAVRTAMRKGYENLILELRERLSAKASEGSYVFCNPTFEIRTREDGKDYFLVFSSYYLEYGSRAELDQAYELSIENLQSNRDYYSFGRNHYITNAPAYNPDFPKSLSGLLSVYIAISFDKDGNIISKEGQMFKEDAPYESQP